MSEEMMDFRKSDYKKIKLLVDGKYVMAQCSTNREIVLCARDIQNPPPVFKLTCERNNIKYMAFLFEWLDTASSVKSLYYPKEEGGILKVKEWSNSLEDLHAKISSFSPELGWFEIKNIGDGVNHCLKIAEKTLHLDSRSNLSLSNEYHVKFTIEDILPPQSCS